MWPLCTANNSLWLLLPLLIGFLTGWWAWARYRGASAGLAYTAPVASPQPISIPDPIMPAPPAAPSTLAGAAPVAAGMQDIQISSGPPHPDIAPVIPESPPLDASATAGLTAIGIPAAVGAPDNLLQIKGVGLKLNSLLNALGVTRFDQIASWGSEDIAKVDAHLGTFRGRIVRDNWVHEAMLLAKGAIVEFEAKYGALDGENK